MEKNIEKTKAKNQEAKHVKTEEKNAKCVKQKKEKKSKKKKSKLKRFLIAILVLIILGISGLLFLLYGPWSGFRDWLITTAMTSLSHQYIATWLFDDETIQDCLNRNKVVEVSGYTDENAIEIVDYTEVEETVTYENEYERQILEKDENNNDYKIIEIDGGSQYHGYMAVIYDPSRIEVATTSYVGSSGEYLTDISKKNNALVAINGGGFVDVDNKGTGGTPVGITISNGKIIKSSTGTSGIIGFNQENKLLLGKWTITQAQQKGIRDCVSFAPYLIMNGESSQIYGNGGWGTAPRTAIGQRADGIVLFLVLDGNRALGKGATIKDLIEIFERYGAINASNLDGGTSTSMTVKGKTVNDPTTLSGKKGTRTIPTAFILKADDSDDGDYSVVQDKVDE